MSLCKKDHGICGHDDSCIRNAYRRGVAAGLKKSKTRWNLMLVRRAFMAGVQAPRAVGGTYDAFERFLESLNR